MAALRPGQKERLRNRAQQIGRRQTSRMARQTNREIGRTQRQTSRRMAGQQRIGARQSRAVGRIGLGGLDRDDRRMLSRELSATSRAIPKITNTLARGYRKEGREVIQGLRSDLREERHAATQSAFGDLREAAISRMEDRQENRSELKEAVGRAAYEARKAIEIDGAPVTAREWRDFEDWLETKDVVSPQAARIVANRLKQRFARKDTRKGARGLRYAGMLPSPFGGIARAAGSTPGVPGLLGAAGRSASRSLSEYLNSLRESER